ncbi:hypothetical protein [Paenibacillus sp. IHBB 3054]|uniref:hypothetical protein n=1 Tax=Paenibacillus sp. IHBB 3054 TaxID=3425689 RepID=UPI003F676121
MNLKLEIREGARDFGTGGAVVSAFVSGFPPLIAVKIKKSEDNSGRKPKYSP